MSDGTQFEVMQFVEPTFGPGESFPGTIESRLEEFVEEDEAIVVARAAWQAHRLSASSDVAWWIVRIPGNTLALWIADSRSAVERVLDLTSNELVEVEPGA